MNDRFDEGQNQPGEPEPPPLPAVPPPLPPMPPPPAAGAQRALQPGGMTNALHPLAAMLVTLATLNLFWLFWLFRAVKRLKAIAPASVSFTPGQAVGFLFIPIYGAFWFIHVVFELPQSLRKAANQNSGFTPVLASCCFLMGGAVLTGLAFNATHWLLVLPWFVAGEALMLAYMGYCQSAVRQLERKLAGASCSDAEPIRYFLGSGVVSGLAALVLATLLFFVGSDAARMKAAQTALNTGDFDLAVAKLNGLTAPKAKFDLAFLYKNGLGVEQDPQKAVDLMTEAAKADYPLAQTTLGLWYANGDGVPADPVAAVVWYGRAAAQGDSNASALIAMAFATGAGEPEDPEKAYEWFSVAEMQGNSYAREQQQQLSVILTDDERSQAELDAKSDYVKFHRGVQ